MNKSAVLFFLLFSTISFSARSQTLNQLEIKIGQSIDQNLDDSVMLLARGFFNRYNSRDQNPMAVVVSSFYNVDNETILKVKNRILNLADLRNIDEPEYQKLFRTSKNLIQKKETYNGLLTFLQLYWINNYKSMEVDKESILEMPDMLVIRDLRKQMDSRVDNELCRKVVGFSCDRMSTELDSRDLAKSK